MEKEIKLKPEAFCNVIDHTFLKTEKEGFPVEKQLIEMRKLIEEAKKYRAFGICCRESMVSYAKQTIKELQAELKIVSVIGFPEGDAYATWQKKELLEKARADGADEFDMVIPYGALKKRALDHLYDDIYQLSLLARDQVLKVIFETCYLTYSDKELAYGIAKAAMTDSVGKDPERLKRRFFKTSTGFAQVEAGKAIGATLEDVKIMYCWTQGKVGIKPAGGVRTFEEAIEFFKAAGSPFNADGTGIDPYLFRIGSSSLLHQLQNTSSVQTANGY